MLKMIKRPYLTPTFIISCNDVMIIRTLMVYFGKYLIDCTSEIENNLEKIEIERDKFGNFAVIYKGKKSITDKPMQILVDIMYENSHCEEGIFAIHAGGVTRNGNAYIFPGYTSSGKTTLVTYLCQNELGYISDDCVFINMKNLEVYPYHCPIHLREGGLKVLRERGFFPKTEYINQSNIQRYVYFPPVLSEEKLALSRIMFINRVESKNRVYEMMDSEAFSSLLKSSLYTRKITSDYIEFLIRISTKCVSVNYCDMSFVKRYIENEKI